MSRYVIKRDGREEPFNMDKVLKLLNYSKEGLYLPDYDEYIREIELSVTPGMKTTDIIKLQIEYARDRIDEDKPDWNKFAGRILIADMLHNAYNGHKYGSLKETFEKHTAIDTSLFDFDKLEKALKPERDMDLTYSGVNTLITKLMKVKKPEDVYMGPQHFAMKIACALAILEDNPTERAIEFYEAISKKFLGMATPTASNSGTTRSQLSSCYGLAFHDSIEGINHQLAEMSLCSKTGGGVGFQYMPRASLSKIDDVPNAAKGAVGFAPVYNAVALAVDQLGCVAKNSYVKILKNNKEKTIFIYEVKEGDLIKSYNIKTKNVEYKEVTSTTEITVSKKDQIKLAFEDGNYIITSNWHPFPKKLDNGEVVYVRSDSIRVGDITVNEHNEFVTVTEVTKPDEDENFYDLTVKDNNNYFCSTHNEDGNFHLIHNTRAGAFAPYMEPWHLDIYDFIELKKHQGDFRKRAHELFTAIWTNDLFMTRVISNGNWTLFDPAEVRDLQDLYGQEFADRYREYEERDDIRKRVIKANDLFEYILQMYFETGSPFLTFKDEANRRNPNKHAGFIHNSNLCTEIYENNDAGKLAVYINGKFYGHLDDDIVETKNRGKVKAGKLKHRDVIEVVKNNSFAAIPIKEIIEVKYIEKRIIDDEMLVCNLLSLHLGRINVDDDNELRETIRTAIRMLDNVIDINLYPTGSAYRYNMKYRSVGLGVMSEAELLAKKSIMFGSQEHFEFINELYEKISYYAIEASMLLAKERGVYPAFKGSDWSKGIFPIDNYKSTVDSIVKHNPKMDWDSLKEQVKKYGMRNGNVMAIAPTSTNAVVNDAVSSIEPVFKRKFEDVSANSSVTMIAPNLTPDTWPFYISAYDVDQVSLVKANAVRQKWIDQGISMNIFIKLPEDGKVPMSYLKRIYLTAWKYGLKSCYYLRSQSAKTLNEAKENTSEFMCLGCS